MEEKILEVCKVTTSQGSPSVDFILPLTFFDLFNSVFAPVEHLFFYEVPYHHSHPNLLSNLKYSLSLTLQYFLPVAGHIIWPQSSPSPFIRYKVGDGVLVTIIKSDDDFYRLSGEKYRECKIFQPLVAQIVRSGNQVPLVAFKITIFPKGGICIGVTANHSLFDGKSTMLFMSSWAYFNKFGNNIGLPKEFTPGFNRKWVRERYPEIENSFLKILKQKEVTSGIIWSVPGPMRPIGMVRGTFVLSQSDVNLLKGLLISRLIESTHVTSFSIIFAYVIQCLVKANPPKNNRVNVSFHFDCRDRLEPRLPRNYFGNCVGVCYKYFKSEELLGWDGMAFFVKSIKTTTHNLRDNGALKEAGEWLPNTFETDDDKESLIVSVYGSTKFEFQNIDFGWGRPKRADIASIDGVGGLFFTRREDSDGRLEVELSLNECEMKKFACLFDHGLIEAKRLIKASL